MLFAIISDHAFTHIYIILSSFVYLACSGETFHAFNEGVTRTVFASPGYPMTSEVITIRASFAVSVKTKSSISVLGSGLDRLITCLHVRSWVSELIEARQSYS